MNKAGMSKFLDAVKKSNSKCFVASTDLGTHLYNDNEHSIIVNDESTEILYCFSTPNASRASQKIQVLSACYDDIHELVFVGSYDEVKQFAKDLGLTLTEEQSKVLLNIKASNYNLKPVTGDYVSFVKLTEEDIEKLSEEEKAKYQEQLKEYEENEKKRNKKPVQVII